MFYLDYNYWYGSHYGFTFGVNKYGIDFSLSVGKFAINWGYVI